MCMCKINAQYFYKHVRRSVGRSIFSMQFSEHLLTFLLAFQQGNFNLFEIHHVSSAENEQLEIRFRKSVN